MMRVCVYLLIAVGIASCESAPETLFRLKAPGNTNIHFNNKVTENDSINPLDMDFLYHGGGVAAGDFNNDGLTDLYFTASQVSNKMYLNRGQLTFEDITNQAGASGNGSWSNGAAIVDINCDGLQDIYVCTSIYSDPARRTNLLYINQGISASGIPQFREMAKEYQLADTGYSVQSAFFDYDNDGDLDMYLVESQLAQRNVTRFSGHGYGEVARIDMDKLYRNDWSDSLKHPVFTDVSREAGIMHYGYGLGVNICDINQDGWKDVYVSNDFYGSDHLYINNHNGTFSEKASVCFKHTSMNAMGNDVADLNNDGLPDVVVLDMNPEDNYRKKKNMNGNNYNIYQNFLAGGFQLQYVKNTLKLNCGPSLRNNDTIGEPVFSEIAYLCGLAETDWSWSPSVADFDNDGNRDIIITNGYPRDITDHDFTVYRKHSSAGESKEKIIEQIPEIKTSNYAFRNLSALKFENVSESWGIKKLSYSYGAVYADLDNDGDLDFAVNNINDKAFIYENTLRTPEKKISEYLKIRFHGNDKNPDGIGAIATIYYDKDKKQVWENAPYRGYLSTVENCVYFGLGDVKRIDSVVITWNNHRKQTIPDVTTSQQLDVYEKNALQLHETTKPILNTTGLFTEITKSAGIEYRHREQDFIDFDKQRLLLHKLSEYGPGLAVADIDGNGLDDICIGGNNISEVQFLLQQGNGKFISKSLPFLNDNDRRRPEHAGIVLFDAENDGDPDLLLTAGGNEFAANTKNYEDRLYINNGKGKFTFSENALPVNFASKGCAKAADFDNDGDLDLFIGGRVVPGRYPEALNGFIYRNESRGSQVRFTDVTETVAPQLKKIGLTCDAVWSDFDNDGWTDLVLAGEWMPVTFFRNNAGRLEKLTHTGVEHMVGLWTSIAPGDFDNDGDMDYVAGNMGLNSYYRASSAHPLGMYAGDFAGNKSYLAIPTLFLPGPDGRKKEFPAQSRDDIVEAMPALRKKFPTYKAFAVAEFKEIFDAQQYQSAYQLKANHLASSYLENKGNGKFEQTNLPLPAQFSTIYGIIADDFNNDGKLDIAMVGNDHGAEVSIGRYDALNGLLLKGDGQNHFTALSIQESGIYVPGNARALVKLRGTKNNYLVAASQNRDVLKLFEKISDGMNVPFHPGDAYALIHLNNGKQRKQEAYYGSSFVSQSCNFIPVNDSIRSIDIFNRKGERRKVYQKK